MNKESKLEKIPPNNKPPIDTTVCSPEDYYEQIWSDLQKLDHKELSDLAQYIRDYT